MRGHVQKIESKRTGTVSYRAFVEIPPHPVTGKRRQRTKTFSTRKAAESELAKWITEIERGTSIEPSKITVTELLTRWLDDIAKPSVRPTTFEDYSATVRNHIVPVLGSKPAQKVTPAEVQAFYTTLRNSGAGPRTVQLAHLRLSQALAWAADIGLVAQNVCARVNAPTSRAREMHVWTHDEANRFLDAAKDSPWQPLFVHLLSSGLRKGEALGLRWQDADLDAGTVTVRQTVVTLDKKAVLQAPKSRAARRTVELPGETITVLKAHKARQNERRLLLGDVWLDNDLIFASDDGSLVHPSSVNKVFAKFVASAGVPAIRVHDLRHTHATWLLLDGTPINVVSARLGHAKPSITLDVYGHLLPGAQKGAVETISRILRGTGT